MQVTATVRRNALDDETDGPPVPGPRLPAPGEPRSTVPFPDCLGRIEVYAAG